MRFTPQQAQAVYAQNPELLVSAAAGSGKTAVLVERIVRMIRDGCDIERMLIVTFTRAAAGEMRERLETRLTDAAEDDPALRRHAERVEEAQISTLHAFCQRVVREHFAHCGIDPLFSLADAREHAAFFDAALQETLDGFYDLAASQPDEHALAARFSEGDLARMIQDLYAFLIARPRPMEWLNRQAAQDSLNGVEAVFLAEASAVIRGVAQQLDQLRLLAQNPDFPDAYAPALACDTQKVHRLQAAAEEGLEALCEALEDGAFAKLKPCKPATDAQDTLARRFRQERDQLKKRCEELQDLLPGGLAQGRADLEAMRPATRALCALLTRFHQNFLRRKTEAARLDFSDLEHLALDVLDDPALGPGLRERFDAVFVDEYQDISQLQEALLDGLRRAPGTGQSFFYVGDVKQSIYRFRQAEPGLFMRKLAAFGAQEDAPRRKVALNRNFRSRGAVLDAVNRVFAHVMDARVTGIDYDEDARLVPGAPTQDDPPVEVHALQAGTRSAQEQAALEAEWVARDIERVTTCADSDGRVTEYRDIAVLLPVAKDVARRVETALSRRGIPVYTDAGAGGEDACTPVRMHLALMENPLDDLALLSVLRSPVFAMTEAELARVRLALPQRDAGFARAMEAAAQAGGELGRRCRAALDALDRERYLLGRQPLAQYLWDYLNRSGLYAQQGAQPGGRRRQAQLCALCEQAAAYEQTHADGLGGFVENLRLWNAGKGDTAPAVVHPRENVVRIMTVHKSKGLEFPVVYVLGLGRELLRRGAKPLACADAEVGLGLEYVNPEARTHRQTFVQAAVELRERAQQRAERARLLYVAMTRPRDRLVLVGSLKAARWEEARARAGDGTEAGVFAVRAAGSMLDWVLQCVRPEDEISTDGQRKTEDEGEFSTVPTNFPQKKQPWRVVFHSQPEATAPRPAVTPPPLPPLTQARGPSAPTFVTPGAPLKAGVTALCRALEQGAPPPDLPDEPAQVKRYPLRFARPRLLSDAPALPAFLDEAPPKDALETGVETHRLLGLMNLEAARPLAGDFQALRGWAQREVERLRGEGVLSARAAQAADAAMAARFLASAWGGRMLRSERVMREWSFTLHVLDPADMLVQGVVDLCFLENGAWTLVDYKTDRVARASDLAARYARQMAYYRRALEAATPYPVAQCALFSLRLGEACEM